MLMEFASAVESEAEILAHLCNFDGTDEWGTIQ